MKRDQKGKIEILQGPNDKILRAIAMQHGDIADKVFRGLKNTIEKAQSYTGYFCVILRDEEDEIIGCANFIQSSKELDKWLYTDLWVAAEHRRMGNAKSIVSAGCDHLSVLGAKILLCSVDPKNIPSLEVQRSLGFKQIKAEAFEFFETFDLLMFKKNI